MRQRLEERGGKEWPCGLDDGFPPEPCRSRASQCGENCSSGLPILQDLQAFVDGGVFVLAFSLAFASRAARRKALSAGAWLRRIGYSGALEPTLSTLHQFVFAHSHAIAYELLDIMLGRTPKLDVGALQRKMGAAASAWNRICFSGGMPSEPDRPVRRGTLHKWGSNLRAHPRSSGSAPATLAKHAAH